MSDYQKVNKSSVFISLKEGLVEKDSMQIYQFESAKYPYIFKDWQNNKSDKETFEVKELYGMSKACFVEDRKEDGFNFTQWKGTFTKVADQLLIHPDLSRRYGWPVQLTDKSGGIEIGLPLMEFKHKNAQPYVRFVGGAYMEDLAHEEEKTKLIAELTNGDLRTPQIVETIPLSDVIAKDKNLPLQNEKEEEYKKRIGLPADLVFENYSHLGLGQNVRRFKNVWRVMDVELMLKAYRSADIETKRIIEEDIDDVLTTSGRILSAEFITSFENSKVLNWLAQLLGEQAGLLVGNNIIHGALAGHLQDITLAGEICDFDQTDTVEDAINEYRKDKTALRVKEQEEYLQIKNFRQLYLIAGHIGPIFDATKLLYPEDSKTQKDIAELFAQGFFKSISAKPEALIEVKRRIEKYKDDQDAGIKILQEIAQAKSGQTADIDIALIHKFSSQTEFFTEVTHALNNIF